VQQVSANALHVIAVQDRRKATAPADGKPNFLHRPRETLRSRRCDKRFTFTTTTRSVILLTCVPRRLTSLSREAPTDDAQRKAHDQPTQRREP